MSLWNNIKNAFSTEQQESLPQMSEEELQKQIQIAEENGKLNGYLNMARQETDQARQQIMTAYGSIYVKVSTVRKQMFRDIERVRSNYLADVILDQVTEDALTPDVSTGEILSVISDNEQIQQEIDFLDEKFNFDRMVQSIAPDMLAYGEYTLRTEVRPISRSEKQENKLNEAQDSDDVDPNDTEYGLVDLYDDVKQAEVVALSKFGDIKAYLVQDDKGKITKAPPADYVQFSVINRSIRIDLHDHYAGGYRNGIMANKDLLAKLPRYVRVGKSLLFPILSKFKELELLEQLVPATKLSKLSNGTIIGVQVPPGYELEKAMALSQKLEGIINKRISVDLTTDDISVSNILNTAGKIKVVPLFGDKGQTQKMDVRSDEPDDLLSSVEDIRKVITSSVGIPYEVIFSDDNANKAEVLKRYARYLRLLKNIQRSIVQGITQIIMIHLANKDIPFKSEDIEVSFRNKLVEVDSLDRLEFLDSSVQMIDNIKNFVNDLAEEDSVYKDAIDLNVFLDFIDQQLSMVGLAGLVNSNVEVEPNDIPDDGEDGLD